MKTLEQIQEQLDFTCSQIEKYFLTINTPDNVMISKDRYWGRRNIHMHIRMDEFSLEQLKETLPKLEKLFNEYSKLRATEKEISDKLDIERATRAKIDIRLDST